MNKSLVTLTLLVLNIVLWNDNVFGAAAASSFVEEGDDMRQSKRPRKTQVISHEEITKFQKLHKKGDPLVLINVWDVGTTKIAEKHGAKAVATSSYAIALSQGYEDGENMSFNSALCILRNIVKGTYVPITFDFEGGFSENITDLKHTTSEVIESGVVGINFEDQVVHGDGLYSIECQAGRIKAIRSVSEEKDTPIFINARTDIFFKNETATHNKKLAEEALKRARAYAEAGADGFFVPGLTDRELIRYLCDNSPIPVNIMVLDFDKTHIESLSSLGVARISVGPAPYLSAMEGYVGFYK
jgi:2-methylisocitrate lyase-like PEP mutase family enzyme